MAGYYRQTGVGELALPNLHLTAPTLANKERNGVIRLTASKSYSIMKVTDADLHWMFR